MLAFFVPSIWSEHDSHWVSTLLPIIPCYVWWGANRVQRLCNVSILFNEFSLVTSEAQEASEVLTTFRLRGIHYHTGLMVPGADTGPVNRNAAKIDFLISLGTFCSLSFRPGSVSTVSTSPTYTMCSARVQLWIIILSRYTTMNLCFIGSKMLFNICMNSLGAFARPNSRTRHSCKPNWEVKDVFCVSAVAMWIWWWPATRSNCVNQQEPRSELRKSLMCQRGYQSLMAMAITAWQSIHILSIPSGIGTDNSAEWKLLHEGWILQLQITFCASLRSSSESRREIRYSAWNSTSGRVQIDYWVRTRSA